jgi:hypothetical protein
MSKRLAGLGLAASVVAAFALLSAAASAAPGIVAKQAQASEVQPVYYCSRRAWRRGLCGEPRSETYVAAPFVRVYSGRYGTWVRAPFVNLWNPR